MSDGHAHDGHDTDGDGATQDILEDMYGDVSNVAEKVTANRLGTERQLSDLKKRNDDLVNEVKALKRQGRILVKQRDVLLHNLGALLKTAQAEMTRKDNEIKSLRAQVMATSSSQASSRP